MCKAIKLEWASLRSSNYRIAARRVATERHPLLPELVCSKLIACVVCALLAAVCTSHVRAQETDVFFENRIRPVLVEHCIECHGARKQESSLRLDVRTAAMRGGDRGPAIVPRNVDESSLIIAVRYDSDELQMPPDKRLDQQDIDALVRWVEMGAPWPEQAGDEPDISIRGGPISDAERAFWSFQPRTDPQPPDAAGSVWPRNGIDRFILASLATHELTPVPAADRPTLLRRATFDLTGFPPTPSELQSFLADESPQAFERVIDRLLDSPAYGERWARHWLDVVRYADTAGETADFPVREAYKYRNYVIDAFNADKPYADFIREQLAGDLLAEQAAEEIAPERFEELVTATGYIAISRRFGFDPENYHHLTISDTIDTLGQSLLGLSLGCARCHDHKYDPVNKEDYYAWYGVFESTRYAFPGSESSKAPRDFVPAVSPAEATNRQQAFDAELAALETRIEQLEQERSSIESKIETLVAVIEGDTDTRYSWNPFAVPIRQRLLDDGIEDVDGNKGFYVWRPKGQPLPTIGVNVTDIALTVPGTVPPKGVVVHPLERDGIAIAWRSPIEGTIDITGYVADAHNCGDSVLWYLDRLSADGMDELVDGAVKTNSRQSLEDGQNAERLAKVDVKPGDFLQLTILPKAHYGCDLTSIELSIRESKQGKSWSLVRDIVPDLHEQGRGNPHSDAHDNPDVWYFYVAPQDRGASWASTKRPPEIDPEVAKTQLAALRQKLMEIDASSITATARRDELTKNGAYQVVYGVVEGHPADARIQRRGDPKQAGEAVPRRNLDILGGQPLLAGDTTSGRLELADWLTSPDNPLTARVMVNRIWQHHFGDGLVATENDFGIRGERPSHPELLDWLASRFVESGWSLKQMHRLIMNSATYRMSTRYDPDAAVRDPDSRLRWRFNRRRLSAEELRDALLLISGDLDPTRGGPHPFPPVESWGFSQHAPFYGLYDTNRRSVYLMQQRLKRHPFLALFDGADPNVSTASRTMTTTPTQALYLMNDAFVHERSESLARQICQIASDNAARIQRAYELTLCRPASVSEIEGDAEFLDRYQVMLEAVENGRRESDEKALAALVRTLFVRNEFLFVD